jgi:carbonic anhydrase
VNGTVTSKEKMMADIEQTTEVEESEDVAYDRWLAALEEDDEVEFEEVPEEVNRDDKRALKVAQQTKHVMEGFLTEQKVEDMKDKFIASASDTAKELFAIYCTGDEDPKQLKRIMDLAKTKAAETEVDPEAVEKAAAKKAQEAYGVSPISQNGPVAEEDQWAKAREKVRAGGSEGDHFAFKMWNSLPASGESSVQAGD